MLALTRSRCFLAVALTLIAAAPFLCAADGGMVAQNPPAPSYIVVGFVGGFVRHDNPHQGPVVFAQRLKRNLPGNSYIQVFENRHRKTAYKKIFALLDTNHNGTLTDDERAQAHIILFGHSWGASAAVLLARELNRAGIPVMLTIQVDSVAKPWQNDDLIPDNVIAAVNFYQPHGWVHGRRKIRAADKMHTQILGNFRYDYHENPIKCDGLSWFDRAFTPDHMQSECDPHLWSQAEALLFQRMQPQPGALAGIPTF